MSKYRVNITWSEEDEVFIARVPELEGVVTHGDSVIEAARHAEEAIDLHLKTLKALNEPIPVPAAKLKLSGNMSLRMGKERHVAAHIAAEREGKSLNEYINTLIDQHESPSNINDSSRVTVGMLSDHKKKYTGSTKAKKK